VSDNAFKGHVNRAITSGEEKGDFSRPKGMSRASPTLQLQSRQHNATVDASQPSKCTLLTLT
jgi:hypothetical protein